MIAKYPGRRPLRLGGLLLTGMMMFALNSFGQVVRPPGRTPMIVQPPRADQPAAMKLRIQGQDVVAQIRNTPLQDVLSELAAWSGVVFEIDAQENPPISIDFFSVPLPEAIERLTGSNHSISFYSHDETGQERISFVRILSRTPRPNPPVLHYLGTGAIVKRSDDIVDSPEQAVVVLAGSSNLAARQKAIEVLAATKSAPAIQALKMVLADPAVEIKVAAIDSLASLGVRDALPQILPALKDAHPGVRQSAVVAVGLLGDSKNIKDLRPLLKDPDSAVIAAADVAIQKLATRRP
jgi:hypothetical protein